MSAENDFTPTLSYPGGEIDLNIVKATEGSDSIALGSLLADVDALGVLVAVASSSPQPATRPPTTPAAATANTIRAKRRGI